MYDLDHRNHNFARQVVACFCPKGKLTADYIHGLMLPIFDVVEEQMEILMPNWGENFTQDEAETVIHNGLIFAARVLRCNADHFQHPGIGVFGD